MADYSRDRAVTRVAGGQQNLIGSVQLAECGLGKDAVARRVRAGWLRLVFQGVYSVGSGELVALARERAALMSCGTGSFISHRSSAFIWGMRMEPPPTVEVSVLAGGCRSHKGMQIHRIQAIDPRELRRHDGLWVSSPARAVLEVAAVGSRGELIDVVDQGLALRPFTPGDLKAVLTRNPGRRGAGRMAELITDDTAMAISRSLVEKAFLRLIRDSGLPMPETNVPFGRFEADFVWREQRLIVELDSATYHSGPGVFQRDREKALVFRDAGFDTMRLTRGHVVHQPTRTVARVTRALASGEAPPA